MKKKSILLIVILLLTLVVTGCVFNDKNKTSKKSDGNVAVIYFSATGTTESVAKKINSIVGGDIIKILPAVEYTDDDLNNNSSSSRTTKEQSDPSSRPAIQNDINTDDYDIIYLGYPIWYSNVPHIILTFIDTHDLKGKTVIPFCTSGSSSITTSMNTLKNYNSEINWIDGKRLTNNQTEIQNWIDSLSY